ncbi:MAG: TRAM domain-containing protein [Candidatus Micrarchaeota archaeon]|nr:TRAM domain-containing protein [Candidatus Micrarchaeota archaeon]MDE1846531.1 TRAM domain-containing protein [Candidatus Micrarchaeota archaeon]
MDREGYEGRSGGYDRGAGRERRGGMGIKPNYFLPKPVKVGDVVDVTIEAVASKGDGIAKKDGFVIFVAGAKQGETVQVKITDVKARFAIGERTGSAGASAAPSEPADESSDESSESEEMEA